MGSHIEINDTLKIPTAQIPVDMRIGKTYKFSVSGLRLYHLYPTRVFLVEERNGKWNYIGHCLIEALELDALTRVTNGTFKISKVYSEDYRLSANLEEAPEGKGYLGNTDAI